METETEIVAFKPHRPGIRLRIHPPKRRSALQRLKSKLYYRRNKTKIRSQRRRYLRQHKSILRHRKLFQRFKPSWLKKPKHPHISKPPKMKKFKLHIPKFKKEK